MTNLWIEVGNKCLEKALMLLDKDDIPTKETVQLVFELIRSTVELEHACLRREEMEKRCQVVDLSNMITGGES